MPDIGPRMRGVRIRTLLLGGGAAAVITAAIALSGAGTAHPNDQRGSAPQAVDARPAVAGHDASRPAPLEHKASVSSALPAQVSLALPHKTFDRDERTSSAKERSTARTRAHLPEPHRRHGLPHSTATAGPAADRHPSKPSSQAKRVADDPRPPSWDLSSWGISPSMIGTKCDELFPPRAREYRLRNIACHHVFN